MLKNYLLTTVRNLTRNKRFSFINIFGLALGTACCLYIFLYVKDQYNYDKHHEQAESIYRITSVLTQQGETNKMATCSPPIPMALKADFPEVLEATRFIGVFTDNQQIFRLGENVFYESNGAFADSTFFNVFTYKFIYGQTQNALTAPYSIVLSHTTAQKIFGDIDPVGRSLEMDTGEGRQQLKVTAVVETLGKSHIQANFILSMDSGGIGSYALSSDQWLGNNFTNAYVKLQSNANVAILEEKLPAFLKNHSGDQIKHSSFEKRLGLQPITSIHTTGGFTAEPTPIASTTLLSILLGIAILIQLIACINFMNLSTAYATRRAKEIGIRKVVGAQRPSLILQFLAESTLIAFLALLIAIPLVNMGIPYLNQITGVELSNAYLSNYRVGLILLAIGVTTGLLAGSYPALYLSKFRPLNVLKNKFYGFSGDIGLRQSLVVFQFVLAVSLIIGVIIINAQLRFIQHKDLGFNPQQKLVVTFRTADALKNANSYRDAIQKISGVQSVSRANNYPSQMVFNDMSFYTKGKNMQDATNIKFMRVDEFFINTLDMELIQGRDFKQVDTVGGIIVNEALLNAMQIPTDGAVGQHIYSDYSDGTTDWEIVGVIKDFNFNALYSEITPFLLRYSDSPYNHQMIIDAQTSDYARFINELALSWDQQIPSVPFEYTFVDEEVGQQYEADRQLSRIINCFTILTILISCLGLFGLVMFTVERRTKEIGIRKVLGASVFDITAMISKDFGLLVLIAVVLSTPLSWWIMSNWLDNFAYQVRIQWWMFALAGFLAILIALLTVSFQSVKAALGNPVEALRNE